MFVLPAAESSDERVCVRVCVVMFGYLSTSYHHAVMLTLKQKRVLMSLSIHHEQGIQQLVARRL